MGRWMDTPSDIKLIGRARKGDRDAFERLVEGNYMLIYRVAYRYLGSREDAEDVTQEVCIKLARVISSYKGVSSFRTWLYSIVVNASKDYIRKHSIRRRHEGCMAPSPAGATDALSTVVTAPPHAGPPVHVSGCDETGDRQADVLSAIRGLPEKYRDALVLVHYEDMSHKEAALVLKCAESTVSWRVHEARKKLKSILTGRAGI